MGGHVEDGCGLRRVIDDDVVYVVVVYYVCDVRPILLRLRALCRVSRRWTPTSHAETLAV